MDSYNHIVQLIARYWAGQTTLEEERRIREFYLQNTDLPIDLEKERHWFVETRSIQQTTVSPDFDHRILSRIVKRYPVIPPKRSHFRIGMTSVAATLLIIIAIGVKHKSRVSEQEAEKALETAKEILYFASTTLNRTEKITTQELNKINIINEYISTDK